MRVSVAFTPDEVVSAPVAIAIDVIRATSTIAAAFAAGFEAVRCVREIDDARAFGSGGVRLAGERDCVRIEGFDFGNSPVELEAADGRGELVLTTTNGTRLLVAASERCERVIAGSLANLATVVAAVRADAPESVAVLCAGSEGSFALDDAYCAGRFVQALDGENDDSAVAAAALAAGFATPLAAFDRSSSAKKLRRADPGGSDVAWCARESVLAVAPLVAERGQDAVLLRPGATLPA